MRAKPAYRDRPDVQVELLDALVDRTEGGMTVFELRAAVEADIDEIEAALAALKEDALISVESADDGLRIFPADRVVPDPAADPGDERTFLDVVRERLGL